MPIFEYRCTACEGNYEILFKSAEDRDAIKCPSCGSGQYEKKFSTFAASVSGSGYSAPDFPCSGGSCGLPPTSPCAGGMCGLD